VVHECKWKRASEGDQWDSSANLSSFLQKVLQSTRTKERLEGLKKVPLLEHVSRQLGETLVGSNLLLSRMRRARELASQKILQSMELKRRLTGLALKVDELCKIDRETKNLLFEKSEETLRLYVRNGDLQAEVDGPKEKLGSRDEEMTQMKEELTKLKEEMAKLKEELVRKDELFQQTKDEFTSDVADSCAAGFEDVWPKLPACIR